MKSLIKTTVAVVFASFLMFSCGEAPKSEEHNHDTETHSHEGEEAHEHDHDKMREVRFICPMECEGDKTYEEPGECPVCHMNLEEKK